MIDRSSRPTTEGGSFTPEKSDASMVSLLGGKRYGEVTITHDQFKALAKFYGYDLVTPDNPLELAGAVTGVFRDTEVDGKRVMAFLAGHGLLEEGEDPVRSLAMSIQPDLFSRSSPDIWEDEDY